MNKSIKITENTTLGRYSVIDENVSPGEILFDEYPFVVGPKNNSKIICLGCCCPFDAATTKIPKCAKCKWPLCENCVNEQIHNLECEIFVKNSVEFYSFNATTNDVCFQLDCITPLR